MFPGISCIKQYSYSLNNSIFFKGEKKIVLSTDFSYTTFPRCTVSTLNSVHSKKCMTSVSRPWCDTTFCWQSLPQRQEYVVPLSAVPLIGSCPTLYTYLKCWNCYELCLSYHSFHMKTCRIKLQAQCISLAWKLLTLQQSISFHLFPQK